MPAWVFDAWIGQGDAFQALVRPETLVTFIGT
jgi:hypothetical protein